jgi:F-type H+-transporting ATPase subunit delta
MKITANQYAKSLYKTIENKSPKEISGLVSNFVKVLAKNRQMKLFSEISQRFSEIWNKENEIVEAIAITKIEMGDKEKKEVENYIKKKYAAKEVVLKNITDEKIKGGIIIKVGDEVLDGSLLEQLMKLKSDLIN